ALSKTEFGGLVAEDGVGGALDAFAETFEGAGDTVLFATGLFDETALEQFAAGAEFLVGAVDALFAQDVVEAAVEGGFGPFGILGGLTEAVHELFVAFALFLDGGGEVVAGRGVVEGRRAGLEVVPL